jgi:ribonuclease HII
MRRVDALYPAYGFAQHVGYITPGHSAVVRERGPCAVHRLSFQALCYGGSPDLEPLEPLPAR